MKVSVTNATAHSGRGFGWSCAAGWWEGSRPIALLPHEADRVGSERLTRAVALVI